VTVTDDIRKAIDAEWRDAQGIHARVAMWSLLSVRLNLRKLAQEGEIERRKVPARPAPTSEYRLKPQEGQDGQKLSGHDA
jgi:DNA-binding HxlR family transcriptional regulator